MQERSIYRSPPIYTRTRDHVRPDWGSHTHGPGLISARAGDGIHNLGMHPYQESNLQPFGYRMMLLPTKSHWPEYEQIISGRHNSIHKIQYAKL